MPRQHGTSPHPVRWWPAAARRGGCVSYPRHRPLVHLRHHLRIRRAVTQRDGRAVVVHDTATRAHLRRWIARLARGHDRQVHLLLLDGTAADAWSGQVSRVRRTSSRRFARHVTARRELLDGAVERPAEPGDHDSWVILDRRAARGLRHIAFTQRAGSVTICQDVG